LFELTQNSRGVLVTVQVVRTSAFESEHYASAIVVLHRSEVEVRQSPLLRPPAHDRQRFFPGY
jgi:hypothetical protein